jgi:hypothetical protein
MNCKNVLYLLRVERKSGRLIRGVKTTRYRESGILAYWPYWVAAIIGIAGGLLANIVVQGVYSSISGNPSQINVPPLSIASINFFVTMPTLILILSIVFTMLQQIQLAGLKATSQPMYWLPVTWQEHTLASILANLLGFPLATVIGFASGLIVFAAFNALIWQAILTTLALFAAAFMGSATTEILRVLQVRFTGAVYKSSGRAAVWVRFIGSLVFFLVFYIIYFSITNGFTNFIQGLANIQNIAWFIPYIWPGLTLFYLLNTLIGQSILFISLTVAFMAALYYIAVKLNIRFGLYEPPAITVQKTGTVYAPKTGFLGKIGFSSVEAALIRKDIRAFTRRRELISIFIVPIVFIIIPLLNSVNFNNNGTGPVEVNYIFVVMTFLFPACIMAMSMGNMLIGEEGQAVWRIYASPISPKNLVRSKLFFLLSFSTVILVITGTVGLIFYHPSLKLATTLFLEAFFTLMPVGAIALAIGFKGADFSAARRARMIRQEWSLISLIVCAVTGLAVVAPIIPFAINKIAAGFLGIGLTAEPVSLAIALVISGIISGVITAVFYRVNINSASTLLRKAEV